jgi:hypothetical protein
MEDWRRDYNEVRPHSRDRQQGADIAVEWLIGAPADMSLTPENSSAGWPRFGEHFKIRRGFSSHWMKTQGQITHYA